MNSEDKLLSFMDLLDLDEEVIDLRVENLMAKRTFTNEHLNNLSIMLLYKQMINNRESSECDNDKEYSFLCRVISNVTEENVDILCKVVTAVLTLNQSSIVFKSEHLIQQIIPGMYLPSVSNLKTTDSDIEKLKTTFVQLKICESVLNAVVKSKAKLCLPFLDIPLEHLILSKDEKLLIYFLTSTVPQLFQAIDEYNILDRIWIFLKGLEKSAETIFLKVLCCLSNYYLPVQESESLSLESDVIFHSEFWDFILVAFQSNDTFTRKKAMYLMKRAIDYVLKMNKNITISSKGTFHWNYKNKEVLKKMWDNFFILIESIEEKQSNIVLPSLILFESVKNVGHCWLNCAFNIGLKHDNTQVRLKCLHYRLQFSVLNESEAVTILEALNDVSLYDSTNEYQSLKEKFYNLLQDNAILIYIIKAIPLVKWSPVPLYYLTAILKDIKIPLSSKNQECLGDILHNLIKVACNNVIIRLAVQINISIFIGNCCKDLPWRSYISLVSSLNLKSIENNPFTELVRKSLNIPDIDRDKFLKEILFTTANVDFALLSMEKYKDNKFICLINRSIEMIQDVNERPYFDKSESLNTVIYLTYLYKKILQNQYCLDEVNETTAQALKTILRYIETILASNITLDIEKMALWFDSLDHILSIIPVENYKVTISRVHKTSMLLLHHKDVDAHKKSLSIFILSTILRSPKMIENPKREVVSLKIFINIIIDIKLDGDINRENSGRMRNAFYEKACEIVNILTQHDSDVDNNILTFIDIAIESGGYGCLKWVIRITNQIMPLILNKEDFKFNPTQFLNKMWNEIEELKSNNQYAVCMEEFVKLITNDTLLRHSEYNNIILLYCSKIIDYASVKNLPLYLLVKQMNTVNISKYSHMIYVLSDILLCPIVPRKDNRVIEKVLLDILQNPIYGVNRQNVFFNSHIQFLAVSILSRISEPEMLKTLNSFIIKKMDDLFKNKQRYHKNSQLQRTLQALTQNLLLIMLKSKASSLKSTTVWCMELLGRIPHQPYVRICLEWYIALYFYLNEHIIDEDVLNQLQSKNVPLQSQFVITYWIAVHKIKIGQCKEKEYDFTMEFLLSHTMGPVYGIRLYAQYLSTRLYDVNKSSENKLDDQKYAFMVKNINNTLDEAAKVEDKTYKKLLNDYFFKNFDIVDDLTPCAIYWSLPQLSDSLSNEVIEDDFLIRILDEIDESLELDKETTVYDEWKERRRKNTDVLQLKADKEIVAKSVDNLDETGTIQKKYVPWKDMSDVDVYHVEKIRNKSELIVVASLIDKLPNLGGMARTSEVFGIKTYVVDSLRHVQDKQFQGLSVSAERWVNIEEVRPGKSLKEYLMMKKSEGYSIVAAEQTSTSANLQNFKFPKNTLLLLGHEKEGVPCDLLPLMDYCVEIPQQGVIRSLNVHVTAAIFIWEYARQHML